MNDPEDYDEHVPAWVSGVSWLVVLLIGLAFWTGVIVWVRNL